MVFNRLGFSITAHVIRGVGGRCSTLIDGALSLCIFTDLMNVFCQWEDVEANCSRHEVVLIQHAKYGRMRLGRSVHTNTKYEIQIQI